MVRGPLGTCGCSLGEMVNVTDRSGPDVRTISYFSSVMMKA